MATPVLELTGLNKQYSNKGPLAVADVSITVQPGELLALVGESGCGKTTLLRLIAGFEQPDSGQVVLEGQTLAGAGQVLPPEKRPLGLVFQDYALFPHFTVAKNVAFGLKGMAKADKAQRVEEMLALVDLSDSQHKYPHELSGGQQQRVALARALAPHPRLLLLDEPFSNLDAVLKGQVRDELSAIIRRSGTTAILVTHDTQDALSVADRIAIMRKGRLLQCNTPNYLFDAPADAYVAGFFGATNLLPATVAPAGYQTQWGQLPLASEEGQAVRPGQEGLLMVRPASISLHEATAGVPGTAQATVKKCQFYGEYYLVTLQHTHHSKVTLLVKCPKAWPVNASVVVQLPREGLYFMMS